MHIRSITRRLAGAAALATVGSTLCAGVSAAAPPAVDGFDVEFVDPSCGPGLDAVVNLHVEFTDKFLPDGGNHHWINLDGSIRNDANDRAVTLHAARRFTDSPTGDSSIFRGLQSQFSAPGEGVLFHTSGWSDDVVTHGRWDAAPQDGLPQAVCDYLFG
jgi:hypothetical protein